MSVSEGPFDEAPLGKLLRPKGWQSFEPDEPTTASVRWELIEYLSYTISCSDDQRWLDEMRQSGKLLAKFDK